MTVEKKKRKKTDTRIVNCKDFSDNFFQNFLNVTYLNTKSDRQAFKKKTIINGNHLWDAGGRVAPPLHHSGASLSRRIPSGISVHMVAMQGSNQQN